MCSHLVTPQVPTTARAELGTVQVSYVSSKYSAITASWGLQGDGIESWVWALNSGISSAAKHLPAAHSLHV